VRGPGRSQTWLSLTFSLEGFTGTYSDGFADIDGTALLGNYGIPFRARLTLKSRNSEIQVSE
jgi:hypothetical protein